MEDKHYRGTNTADDECCGMFAAWDTILIEEQTL